MSRLAVAILVAAGFLAGVLLVVAVRGIEHDDVRSRTVTVVNEGDRPGVVLPVEGTVPDVTRSALDEAKRALDAAGYREEVKRGGGLFGPVVDANWIVVEQSPAPGARLPQGGTVELAIERG